MLKIKNETRISSKIRSPSPTMKRRNVFVARKDKFKRVKIDSRLPCQERMLELYFSDEGQKLYKHRSHAAETVQGDLKQNGRFLELTRRGLEKVQVDSILHDIAWNLRIIFNNGGPDISWI